MKDLNTYTLKNGTIVHYIEADRFKTVNFTVNITMPLKRPDVTYNSLILPVLKRGCAKYPITKDLNIYLDDLYGANVSYGIKKRGNYQVLSINFNTVADKYAPEVLPFEKLLIVAGEILFNPLIENNGFKKEYVDREKENLKQYIESIINDKKEYAKLRLINEMYSSEAYGIISSGYVDDLDEINPQSLYAHYKKILKSASFEIFVTGPVNKVFCDEFIKNNFEFHKEEFIYSPTDFGDYRKQIKYVLEDANITQGKLTIGMRTNVTIDSPLYYAMTIMNNLYGGSVHSKLFLNVREKMSLAYYAGSMYDSYKGLILVSSGIEFKNYVVARDEICKQLEDMKAGRITKEEFENGKKYLLDFVRSMKDSQAALVAEHLRGHVLNINFTLDEQLKIIEAITVEKVIAVAKKVALDTVYFLKGLEG